MDPVQFVVWLVMKFNEDERKSFVRQLDDWNQRKLHADIEEEIY